MLGLDNHHNQVLPFLAQVRTSQQLPNASQFDSLFGTDLDRRTCILVVDSMVAGKVAGNKEVGSKEAGMAEGSKVAGMAEGSKEVDRVACKVYKALASGKALVWDRA